MNRDLETVLDAARVDADPADLDPAERVEAFEATAEILGLLRSVEMGRVSARQARPDGWPDRLRRAWYALRGLDSAGYTDSLLAELKRTSDETEEWYRKRLRQLRLAIDGEGDDPAPDRSTDDFRVDGDLL